jgi:glycosyltransferase involved in cell wall biosynthesis
MGKADLSILVTSYNKSAQEVDECLRSVADQTVQPKEVILVDDGSKKAHAHRLATTILLPQNIGVAKARDTAFRFSTGKLVLFVDADDKLNPDFIQRCGEVITQCDVAYPNLLLFGDVERNKLQDSPKELFPQYILGKTCSIPVTSMMWRKVYEGLGGFQPLPVYEDWDFWIRAMCKGYIFKRANTILWYRQSASSRNHAQSQEIKDTTYTKITAPYEIKDGRVQLRSPNGLETTKACSGLGGCCSHIN